MYPVQTPRVTETKRLSAHTRQVELVRASLLACPAPAYNAKPSASSPHQTHTGRA
jgi:hypothetical protein